MNQSGSGSESYSYINRPTGNWTPGFVMNKLTQYQCWVIFNFDFS